MAGCFRKLILCYIKRLESQFLGRTMNLPGKVGRKCSVIGYALAQKIFGFN